MTNIDSNRLSDQIDRCLPQTQCTLCTYPRCREYADAIAQGDANINQCPPGGEVTILALADLLGKPVLPLNEAHGVTEPKQIAYIEEAACIGCKLCIKACPVDCIVGSAKLMHTVIIDECTGCKLCLPVCPTDCIHLVSPDLQQKDGQTPSLWADFTQSQVERARQNSDQTIKRNMQREQIRIDRKRTIARKQMQQEILAAVQRKQHNQQNSNSTVDFTITVNQGKNRNTE
jgi:electron transport complex protein RnfB